MLKYLLFCLMAATATLHAFTVTNVKVTVDDLGTPLIEADDKIRITFSTDIASTPFIRVRVYDPHNLNTADAVELIGNGGAPPSTISIPRFQNSKDRIYSAFSVGVSTSAGMYVTSNPPQFVTTFNLTGRDEKPFPASLTKKGIMGDFILPLDTNGFGSQHVLLNIDYAEISRSGTTPPNPHMYELSEFEGENYYFSKCYFLLGKKHLADGTCSTVGNKDGFLDYFVDSLAAQGYAIYLYLVNTPALALDQPDALTHPNYSAATVNGVAPHGISAFNTSNSSGSRKFRAVTEFLADRYQGKIQGYIVGQEINLHYKWYNRGILKRANGTTLDNSKSEALDTLVSDYSRTLRMANTAVRKYSKNARVYTSLTTYWANYFDMDAPPYKWSQFAPSKDFIDVLNTKIKAGGDVDWHLIFKTFSRYSPTNEFFGGGGPWNDDKDIYGDYHLWLSDNATWKACKLTWTATCDRTSKLANPNWLATGDYNTTPMITARNIHVVRDYFRRPELVYNGVPRSIVIGDVGFPVCKQKSNGACMTPSEDPLFHIREDYHAAAIAYQYLKIANLDGIDAWTYYTRTDMGSNIVNADRLGLGYFTNPPQFVNGSYVFDKRKAYDLYVHANRIDWRRYFDPFLYVFADTQNPSIQKPGFARTDLTSWDAVLEGQPKTAMRFIRNPLVPAIITPLLLQ